jgi:DNA-binding transcriptional ArsR family regulator
MDVFAALADPVRRDILRRLRAAPLRVVEIARAYDISRPAVSRHLRVLSEAGVVQVVARGREHHYRLAPEALAPAAALLTELRSAPGTPAVREEHLMALDVEVRRTRRERRTTPVATTEETA